MMVTDRAILAKVRAMYGGRLKPENYEELLRRRTVGELAGYLKNQTSYRQTLAGVQESLIHRGQLESLLRRSLYDDYLRLMKFSRSGSPFFGYYLLEQEIGQLVRCIGYLGAHNRQGYISELPGYLLNRLSIDLQRLARADSPRALLTVLEGTPYHQLLAPLLRGDAVQTPLCEAALYTYYYRRVLSLVHRQYRGKTRQALVDLFLQEAQLYNLRAIYRLKRFFDAPPEEIARYLLPFYHTLSRRQLERLVQARDAAQFLELLREGRLGRYFAGEVLYIEQQTDRLTARQARRLLHFTVSPAVGFTAYLMLRRLEIENIINIAEGVRYGVPSEEIERMLVL